MDFRLLGPLEVVDDDGAALPLGGPRPRALLAQLLLNPNEVVSTDRLIDRIGARRPRRARRTRSRCTSTPSAAHSAPTGS